MTFACVVKELAGVPAENNDDGGWLARSWSLLREEQPFRRFVGARVLLLVSVLSPPFIVAMAEERGTGGLSGLGPFFIASGLAGILGGRLAGRLAVASGSRERPMSWTWRRETSARNTSPSRLPLWASCSW
ncbi:hypothetical protein [Crystallibacter degradans]|uniref:hypothetical protein n=1 Tax=Crystallibacter degradans TaxID=2726743 RepID=UPI0014751567|nr:hypothetical protein [Arthrobacter sp. SF27]NMR28758.1 hypothetical protein [Arthrobacter sp. SF27]